MRPHQVFTVCWLILDWFCFTKSVYDGTLKTICMKNILVIAGLLLVGTLHAQVKSDTASIPPPPAYVPYQFPNYYQNNSMFSNNSLQTNPRPNPFAGPYTGNADYTDPTKSVPGPALYNNINVPQPQQPALNNGQK